MVQSVPSYLGSESGDISGLPEEMVVLHLIATGIIKRATRIELGEVVNGDYEVSLQLGLDRLNILRYTLEQPTHQKCSRPAGLVPKTTE